MKLKIDSQVSKFLQFVVSNRKWGEIVFDEVCTFCTLFRSVHSLFSVAKMLND